MATATRPPPLSVTSGPNSADAKRFQKVEEQELNAALFALIYGVKTKVYCQVKRKLRDAVFFLRDDDPRYLNFVAKRGEPFLEQIDMMQIKRFSDNPANNTTIPPKDMPAPGCLLSIVSEDHSEQVLIFASVEAKKQFTRGIEHFLKEAKKKQNSMTIFDLAQELWNQADQDGNRALDVKEVTKIMEGLNMSIAKPAIEQKFREFDKDNSKLIEFTEFTAMIQSLLTKEEVRPLYNKYANVKSVAGHADRENHMSLGQLVQFMVNEQGMDRNAFPTAEILAMTKKEPPYVAPAQPAIPLIPLGGTNPNPKPPAELDWNKPIFSFYDFISIIFARQNCIMQPEKAVPYMDTKYPLTDYWMNSSHNTYLMGNQLTGESSLEAYIRALEEGCRCVELDCWDGDNGEPIVYHGHTLTSKINFADIIRVVKEFGFKHSHFPIVLSLEMHCSDPQQAKIGQMIRQAFGGSIVQVSKDQEKRGFYPTLEELKNKIIVKSTGSLKNRETWDDFDDTIASQNFEIAEEEDPNYKNLTMKDKRMLQSAARTEAFYQKFDSVVSIVRHDNLHIKSADSKYRPPKNFNLQIDTEIANKQFNFQNPGKAQTLPTLSMQASTSSPDKIQHAVTQRSKTKNKGGANPELEALLAMFGQGFNITGLNSVWNISSLDEDKIKGLGKSEEKVLCNFHRKWWTRIFPKGTRIDSSNYSPVEPWSYGCQVVALNYQTKDEPMLLNFARYQENGGRAGGYVLKPAYMRSNCPPTQVKYPSDFKTPLLKITIQVISGSQLKEDIPEVKRDRDVIDPYVRVGLRGIGEDEATEDTKTVSNNGLNPQFGETFSFTVRAPDFAMLKFEVYDKDSLSSTLIAMYALPVTCLRPGYRVVPMYNTQLVPVSFSYLLVKVGIESLAGRK